MFTKARRPGPPSDAEPDLAGSGSREELAIVRLMAFSDSPYMDYTQ